MPSPAAFLKGFGLSAKSVVELPSSSLRIKSVSIEHKVISRFHRYEFPIKFILEPISESYSTSALAKEFQAFVSKNSPRIIHSQFGSPYDCTIGSFQVKTSESKAKKKTTKKRRTKKQKTENEEEEEQEEEAAEEDAGVSIEVVCHGIAIRNRKKLTLQQQAAQSDSIHTNISKEVRDEYSSSHSIRKSTYGSSKCSLCSEAIAIGEFIAKSNSHKGKGGWNHLACVIAADEEGKPKSKKKKTSTSSSSSSSSSSSAMEEEVTSTPAASTRKRSRSSSRSKSRT